MNQTNRLSPFASKTLVLLRGWGDKPVPIAERYLSSGFRVVLTGPPCDIVKEALENSEIVRQSGSFEWDPIADYKPEGERKHPRWSAGLNLGITHAVRHGSQYFMPVSNEVEATDDQLAQMFEVLELNGTMGSVGTTFSGHLADGTPVGLGRSYNKLRNTLAIWRMTVFTEDPVFGKVGPSLVGFREACDGYGGMEDYDRTLTMIQGGRYGSVVLALNIPLSVGVNYDQPTKEATERQAMERINQDHDLNIYPPAAQSYAA